MDAHKRPSRTTPSNSDVVPELRLDCRHYRGDRPCARGHQGVCALDCNDRDNMTPRVIIIKLGALGDVIRTAALLPAIKRQWPNAHITWVSRPGGVRMLSNHPMIDRLLNFDAEAICHLECETFDLCLSLDKEPGPAALAMRINAKDKRGIGLSCYGTVFPLNAAAAEYFRLGLDDNQKFHQNTRSYQELIFQAVDLPYQKDRYTLHPSETHLDRARRLWAQAGIGNNDIVIGLNTGAGDVFANKTWSQDQFAYLTEAIVTRLGFRVALLGGPAEVPRNRAIMGLCEHLNRPKDQQTRRSVVNLTNGARIDRNLHELEFAALIRRCNAVVTGDTMALHAAIAGDVPTIALFGPTCAQEIELYGLGTKLRTQAQCSPCYRRSCSRSPNCMDEITLNAVLEAISTWVRPRDESALAVSISDFDTAMDDI